MKIPTVLICVTMIVSATASCLWIDKGNFVVPATAGVGGYNGTPGVTVPGNYQVGDLIDIHVVGGSDDKWCSSPNSSAYCSSADGHQSDILELPGYAFRPRNSLVWSTGGKVTFAGVSGERPGVTPGEASGNNANPHTVLTPGPGLGLVNWDDNYADNIGEILVNVRHCAQAACTNCQAKVRAKICSGPAPKPTGC
eukprot:TRINITY_DN6567_c0_g1_i1.p1 TRINITY_DN6567_c0_g1~~TRINITY_DN6567_c0_g1_i1.p1  ORF type:complete len:212 (-),score=26.88 TRINITY_DN6567_c0_g1_i1:131-718(-)